MTKYNIYEYTKIVFFFHAAVTHPGGPTITTWYYCTKIVVFFHAAVTPPGGPTIAITVIVA